MRKSSSKAIEPIKPERKKIMSLKMNRGKNKVNTILLVEEKKIRPIHLAEQFFEIQPN